MKTYKLLSLVALLAFAPIALPAQDIVDLPKVTVETTTDIPVAVVVPEPTTAEAVTTAVSPDEAPNGVEAIVLDVFLGLVGKYPWLATLIIFMGMCRVFAKPAVSLFHSLIDLTPSKKDDTAFTAVMFFFTTNPLGKSIAFGIDWITSVKIKPPVKK